MKTWFSFFFILTVAYGNAQRLDLPDMLIFPFEHTKMTNCKIYSVDGKNTKHLLLGLGGNNGDNFKTQPHVGSFAYGTFVDDNKQLFPLKPLENGQFRTFPSIEIASLPIAINEELIVQQLAGSGSLRFYFKNLRTGSEQYLPRQAPFLVGRPYLKTPWFKMARFIL